MRWHAQIALALLCALVLAGLAHVSAVLAIPWVGDQDAYHRLRRMPGAERTQMVPLGDSAWPPRRDPAIVLAGCAYNLGDGPVRISARTGTLFESLSFHARGGVLFFAVTERAAVRGSLDLVLMTQAQQQAAGEEDGDEPSPDVRIVAPQREGFVIVRVLAGFPSQKEEAEALAKAVTCTTETSAN